MIEDGRHGLCAPHSLCQYISIGLGRPNNSAAPPQQRSKYKDKGIALSKVDRGLLASPGTLTLP